MCFKLQYSEISVSFVTIRPLQMARHIKLDWNAIDSAESIIDSSGVYVHLYRLACKPFLRVNIAVQLLNKGLMV